MRMLFVGPIDPLLTTGARFQAFRELGVEVEGIDVQPYFGQTLLLQRITTWTTLTPGVFAFNRHLLERARSCSPDLFWIEKGLLVFPRTLRQLRELAPVVYHNTDDWRASNRLHKLRWRFLLRGLPLYDAHVTSNLHNVREFRDLGFPRVHHMELAANPAIRDPGPLSEEERRRLGGATGFIGHWEPSTERSLGRLAEAGIPLKIYGPRWEKARPGRALGEAIQGRSVWGREYAQAIRSFGINLGIVSKDNRNHTASRTFQIPALGAFLLHERNELVCQYFREGVEAEFFGSDDELVEKCRYYIDHPDERQRIAAAGQRRCRESGYTETERVRELLPVLEELVGAEPGARSRSTG